MKNWDWGAIIGATSAIVGLLAFILIIFGIGFAFGRDYVRNQALAHGVAEWTIPDPKKGNIKFHWKTPATKDGKG